MVSRLMTMPVIELLEIIHITQQQCYRAMLNLAVTQHVLAVFDKGPSIADTGQRVRQRGLPVTPLRSLLHHGCRRKRQTNAVQQGLKQQKRRKVDSMTFPGERQ